jgi:rod shape-determining protein MreC
MQLLSFLFYKHIDKTILALAVALSIVLLTRSEESKLNASRTILATLLYPVDRIGDRFARIDELTEENLRLKELAAGLYHERERLIQFRDERLRLRNMIGLREDSFYRFLPCEVIARSASRFHNSISVDRGSSDGVRNGMAVVGYRGLVGRVTQVFPHSSLVLLLNNKSISVSCIDKRSRVVGILEWERENLFSLDFVGKEEDVQPGDTLITSGFGRLFPKNFPVGTVFRVTEERGGLSRKVGVVSMTNLRTIEELFIVIGGRDWESDEIYDELEAAQKKR